jgi:hypothetical protein
MPREDQDQHELPDEPGGEADQQGLSQRLVASELIPEPGSDDPRENPHRNGGCRPHREDLSERVLPYGRISNTLCPLRVFGVRRNVDKAISAAVGMSNLPSSKCAALPFA